MNILEESRKMRKIIEEAVQSLKDDVALQSVKLHPMWASGVTYAVGFKARYHDTLYKCLTAHTAIDGWEPDAAPSLWAKVLIPDDGTITAWEQPESTNGYVAGDKVRHNDKVWVSEVDNNVWEPGVYGWAESEET
jgi:hypothetical protein